MLLNVILLTAMILILTAASLILMLNFAMGLGIALIRKASATIINPFMTTSQSEPPAALTIVPAAMCSTTMVLAKQILLALMILWTVTAKTAGIALAIPINTGIIPVPGTNVLPRPRRPRNALLNVGQCAE